MMLDFPLPLLPTIAYFFPFSNVIVSLSNKKLSLTFWTTLSKHISCIFSSILSLLSFSLSWSINASNSALTFDIAFNWIIPLAMALHGVKTKFIIFVIATTSPTVILPAATKNMQLPTTIRKAPLFTKEANACAQYNVLAEWSFFLHT